MSENNVTEKALLLEIERLARLFCYSKNDAQSIEDCRKALDGALMKLAKIRQLAAIRRAEAEAAKYRKKMGIRKGSPRVAANCL